MDTSRRVEAPDLPEPFRPRAGRLTFVFLAVIGLGLLVGTLVEVPEVVEVGAETAPPGGPMVGEPAPEVVLTGFDGTTWRLSSHLSTDGRPVLLNLWASWCLPCRAEMPEISAFADSHPEIEVVGVAVDDRLEDAAALVEEVQPTYLVGMDATGSLRDRYPSFGMPVTFLIDETGLVRHQVEGAVTKDQLEGLLAS